MILKVLMTQPPKNLFHKLKITFDLHSKQYLLVFS